MKSVRTFWSPEGHNLCFQTNSRKIFSSRGYETEKCCSMNDVNAQYVISASWGVSIKTIKTRFCGIMGNVWEVLNKHHRQLNRQLLLL